MLTRRLVSALNSDVNWGCPEGNCDIVSVSVLFNIIFHLNLTLLQKSKKLTLCCLDIAFLGYREHSYNFICLLFLHFFTIDSLEAEALGNLQSDKHWFLQGFMEEKKRYLQHFASLCISGYK